MAKNIIKRSAEELMIQQTEYLAARYWHWTRGLRLKKTRAATRIFVQRKIREAQRMSASQYAAALERFGVV